jgi:hypothetical protein
MPPMVKALTGENSPAVGHDNVFALSNNPKTSLLESSHSVSMIDSRNSWHLARIIHGIFYYDSQLCTISGRTLSSLVDILQYVSVAPRYVRPDLVHSWLSHYENP